MKAAPRLRRCAPIEPPPPSTFVLHVVFVASSASGTVGSSSVPVQASIGCGSDCNATFPAGARVTLLATPQSGSFFGGYAGNCTGLSPTCALMMTADRTVTVKFTPANVIFATSATFTLPTLAAKGGGTGAAAVLAGADAACAEAVAGAGSLAATGKYVAWISSSQSNAIDRIRAAAGGTVPRGWVRVDGKPFMDDFPSPLELNAHILYPVMIDEKGAPAQFQTFTGTDVHGVVITPNCNNWSSSASADVGIMGTAWSGGLNWTEGVAQSCSTTTTVYCMQVDHVAQVTVPAPPTNAKLVFVAAPYDPSSGLAGGDAKCAADASAAGLAGTFRAMLATVAAGAASRFQVDGSRAVARTDNVIVASRDTDLFAARPIMLAPLGLTALGQPDASGVYTGAQSPLQGADQNCNDWTVATTTAMTRFGVASYIGLEFFFAFTDFCTRGTSVYCLQD
jgi:Divergent InlB B-repeat domain